MILKTSHNCPYWIAIYLYLVCNSNKRTRKNVRWYIESIYDFEINLNMRVGELAYQTEYVQGSVTYFTWTTNKNSYV